MDRRDGIDPFLTFVIGNERVDLAVPYCPDEFVEFVEVGQFGKRHQLMLALVVDDNGVDLAAAYRADYLLRLFGRAVVRVVGFAITVMWFLFEYGAHFLIRT